jgi:hypothetical protein
MLARLLIGSLLILAAPAVRAGAWEELVDAGYAYTRAQGEKLEKEFSISKHERWDLDQDTGELVFSNKGKPAVVAKIQFVGSLSTKSKTWLWSWANNSIDPKLSAGMQAVREHGRKNGFTKLTERRWSADNADGWEMTAVANYLLKGKGVYRPPFEGGFSYVVITDIRKAAPR